MTDQHPIAPPDELVEQWKNAWFTTNTPADLKNFVATQAARWGADQELEACCQWLDWQQLAKHRDLIPSLRAARRPKQPSLKEQALKALLHLDHGQHNERCLVIRRALEQLND